MFKILFTAVAAALVLSGAFAPVAVYLALVSGWISDAGFGTTIAALTEDESEEV